MSEALSMSYRQVVIPPTQYVSNLGADEHGILFYTSRKEMRNIHFAFVKSGLENNWGVVYAAPGSYFEELRNEMQKYGSFGLLSRSISGENNHLKKRIS